MAPSKGKEKVYGGDNDKTGGGKRKDRGVLQFFEDSAFEVDEDESSDDDLDINDYLEDEFENDVKFNNEPAKAPALPFIKEEEMDEEELEKMVEERYGPGSSFVTYADDGYEGTKATYRLGHASSSKDPALWKVKCMVGRERHSVFCLMQKFVDLRTLGTKLQIISAFSLDHVKGFIFIEADKQYDVNEASKGLTSIYSSRVVPVPKNEISHVLSVRSKSNNITEGMWARVKNGKYKGDLGQVVAINEVRKKVTVKLIPRIDLHALAEKFGGGVSGKKTSTPAPRLISSSELEEFRPLIQIRRDRDTSKMFEILDGMMLKDGYLYKKVSLDSLSIWGVTPTEDELLKFEPSNNDESNDLEWLSNLYGDRKKKQKRIVMSDKGVGKGESSSSSNIESNFEVHDLVFFGRKDFGVIVGMEKDDCFKVMKEGSEGPIVVTIHMRDLKNASFDKKLFTALDQHSKTISINDTVKVLDGPLKDKQGVVKQIYRGTLFLYKEAEQENDGYLCIKSQKCEKVISSCDESHGKGSEPGPSGFGDFSSSPKSPLSPKKSWDGRGNSNFNRDDKNGMFSVGQSLRIRVGPLKGYLCRVLAVRRSDVTVKLDSQQKILTVKCEHLSEVRGKSSATSLGKDHESLQPFDLLGTTDGSSDWMGGGGMATESGSWNVGGLSTQGNSWPAFPSSSHSLQPDSGVVNTTNTVDDGAGKGDSGWEIKPTSSQNPGWGATGADKQIAADTGQVDGWGKHEDGWKKAASTSAVATGTSDSWGKAVEPRQEITGQGNSWGQNRENWSKNDDSSLKKTAWNSSEPASENQTGGWGNAGQPEASGWKKPTGANENQIESWSNKKNDAEGAAGWGNGSNWGKTAEFQDRFAAKQNHEGSWGDRAAHHSSKPAGGSSWQQADEKATESHGRIDRNENWGKQSGSSWSKEDGGSSWSKEGGSSWGKQDGGSSWNKRDGGSSWSKEGRSSWGKQGDGSSWNKRDGGSSWSKPAGGSSWSQQSDTNAQESKDVTARNDNWGKQSGSSWSKEDGKSSLSKQVGSSWGKLDGGSSWNKRDGGSSWSKPAGGSSWNQQSDTNGQDSKDVTARNDNRCKLEGGSSWSKQASGSSWSDKDGGSSCWSKPGGGSSWGQQGKAGSESKVGTKQNDNWAKQEGGSSWSKQEGGSSWNNKQDRGSSWGPPSDANAEELRGDKWGKQEGGSWSRPAGGSSWGEKADVNAEDQSKGKRKQNDSWSKQDGSSSWNRKDGGSSWNNQTGSSWNDETGGGKGSWDSQKVSQDNSSAWNVKKTSEGGSSTGWGQSNKWNSGVDNGSGNQNSAWSSKSNWSSGNDFGGSQEQTDNSYRGRGRGGNWRGGRGGRGGRGESDGSGFGGRDGSEQGSFGGRDGSQGGRFGGRGRFERGGFGGRGRSDRGGFHGRGHSDRGGFGGRGRGRSDQYGDWNKRNDSGEDKPQSWYKSSNTSDGGGNDDYKGSWNRGDGDSGQWKSWSSGWNQLNGNPEDNAQAGWSKKETSWKTSDSKGGWSDQKPGWGQGSTSWGGSAAGTWNKPSGTDGAQAKQGNGAAEDEGPAGCNAQAGWSRQENSWKTSDATGGWNQGNTSRSGSLGGSWNKLSGSDGGQAKQGNGAAEGPADSWSKAAANSWGKANDGGW